MEKRLKTAVVREEESDSEKPRKVPHVVIVGAGFGGLQAAKSLRQAPVQVTVIDRSNHHLFQPLLYQVATADLSPADIAAPIRSILRKQRNTSVILAEVTGVDVQGQRVLMHERSAPYDYLIVATGARHSYFGHDAWEPFAPGIKSIDDAAMLRRKILLAFEAAEIEPDPEKRQALLTFVLVGAGPTGVEMAGAIAELAHKALASDFRQIDPKAAHIVLVEALPRILLAFPESLANKAERALTRLGVEVRKNSPVEAIDREGVVIAGERLRAKTVIWTAGVAASPAGHWLGAEVDRAGRIKVGSDLSLPGHPNVFVIGDTASLSQDGKALPGVAPVAMQEGRYVAQVIVQRVAGHKSIPPFRYHSRGNLATVGRSFAVAEIGPVRLSGFLAWVLWLVVHISYLIGFRNRLLVMLQWAWEYLTRQRSARLITCGDANEPSVW
jgi:NADH dehydrogenase